MLISNVFINCIVKGKNFLTRKQLRVSSNSEQKLIDLNQKERRPYPLLTTLDLKCEYIKAGLGIKV